MAPFLQVIHGGVAQQPDFRTMAPQQLRAFLDLGTAGVIFTPGMGVFDHGVGDHQAQMRRDRRQPVLQGPAIEQQSMILGSAAGDELVHDAGRGADKVVLSPLAKPGYFAAVGFSRWSG